ncbi:MAG: hypothetical protein GY756_10515 [bacterium]|nr:hypothetical protein [bacterium]
MKNYTQKELKEIAQSKAESMTFEEMRETINYLRSNFPETLKAGYKVLNKFSKKDPEKILELYNNNDQFKEEITLNGGIKFKVKLNEQDTIFCLMYLWNILVDKMADLTAELNEEIFTTLTGLIKFHTKAKAAELLEVDKSYITKVGNGKKALKPITIIEYIKTLNK